MLEKRNILLGATFVAIGLIVGVIYGSQYGLPFRDKGLKSEASEGGAWEYYQEGCTRKDYGRLHDWRDGNNGLTRVSCDMGNYITVTFRDPEEYMKRGMAPY